MDFLVDVDEVLTDFVGRLTPVLSGVLNREWSCDELPGHEWDIFSLLNDVQKDAVNAVMERPGFCASFEPSPIAQATITALREHCNVFAVTAPSNMPHWVHERYYWLDRYYGFDRYHVVHTHAKHKVAGDFFLDDNPKHVTEWAAKHPTGTAMLWTAPSNRRTAGFDNLRVHSWAEVLERVRARCTT
jgi:5'(3')-deoxyribonucleotidase